MYKAPFKEKSKYYLRKREKCIFSNLNKRLMIKKKVKKILQGFKLAVEIHHIFFLLQRKNRNGCYEVNNTSWHTPGKYNVIPRVQSEHTGRASTQLWITWFCSVHSEAAEKQFQHSEFEIHKCVSESWSWNRALNPDTES